MPGTLALGFAAHLGWACTAAVYLDQGRPQRVRTYRIATAPEGERESREPYHVAGGFDGLDRVAADNRQPSKK